ncbi:MAG: DUF305 domain-containing protein [Actinomycetota bacterium]|nr:DUF305 domain-containing protein [Rubrobacter sp.]MDQ3509012.1 DUF305 domain-containing protein [Actinomycetota bacterium]
MKRFTKLGLASFLLAASLTLAACGGAGGGDGMEESEMSGMEGMEESTMGEMSGMEGMEETTGMSGMDDGPMDMGSMDMDAMLMEDGEYSDERFIDLMVPHHEGAVDMAEISLDGNAENPEVEELSRTIIETQNAEIEELRDIKEAAFGTREISEDVSEEDMAMMRMMDDPEAFAASDPFDLAFIEQMTPHHESAIDMAEVALENSENEEIRTLAEEIIAAQEAEIEQMEAWREEWYPES